MYVFVNNQIIHVSCTAVNHLVLQSETSLELFPLNKTEFIFFYLVMSGKQFEKVLATKLFSILK